MISAALSAGVIGVAACGGDEPIAPKPLSTSAVTKRDAGSSTADDDDEEDTADAGSGVAPPPDSPTATTYAATLDATATVAFGGSPFCDYKVTLRNVAIELAALPSGQVISATAKNRMVEATTPASPTCNGVKPLPPSEMSFSLKTTTDTPDGTTLLFVGAATNAPKVELIVDLKKSGSSSEAAASWRRTDGVAAVNWTVKAKLALVPR